jgi:hypothetical protein
MKDKIYFLTEDEFNAIAQTFRGVFTKPIIERSKFTQKELTLAGELLEMASESFGRHSCNDAPDEWWENWTIDERKAFSKDFEDYNSKGRDYDPDHYEMQDFAVAGFLAYKFGFRRPQVPKIKYLLTNEQVRNDSQLVAQSNSIDSVLNRCIYDGNNFIVYKYINERDPNNVFNKSGWIKQYASIVDRVDGEYPYFVPERD